MRIAELADWRAVRLRFETSWAARHPSVPPPALYPAFPNDPLWVEASSLMDQAMAQTVQSSPPPQVLADVRSPRWVALAGYISCPNNHGFPVGASFCPSCGAGPVPADITWAANDAAALLGARAGQAMLHQFGL